MNEQCEDVTEEGESITASAQSAAPGPVARAAAFWRGDTGQALVEYALILMLVAIACIVVLGGLGDILINTYYNRIMNALPG